MSARLMRILAPAAACALGACGGGGGLNSPPPALGGQTPPPAPAPTPAPTPTPTPPAPVAMLDHPATQEFTTYAGGSPIRVRYDAAADTYEVNYSGDWQKLYPNPSPGAGPGAFLIGGATVETSMGYGGTINNGPPGTRYQYSNLESSGTGSATKGGVFVLGTPTPAAAVPISGTATYSGQVQGTTTAPADGGGWGIIETPWVQGSISMNIDFAKGAVSGTVTSSVSCDCYKVPRIPAMTFDAQLGTGTGTFAGQFNTQASGSNAIAGLLTGPQAQEAIGQWSFPFVLDGKTEGASGVLIAKKN